MTDHPLRSRLPGPAAPLLAAPLLGAPLLAALLLAALASPADAAPRTVYAGTLQGAGDVVMELDSQPVNGVLTGRYFYPKHGVDIPLNGTLDALREPKTYQQSVDSGQDPASATAPAAAIWQGTLDASGYHGRWVNADSGKARPFALRRIADYDPDALAPGSVQAVTDAISGGVGSGIDDAALISDKTAPYDYLKLAGHAAPVGADSGSGSVAYRMWRDPRTGFGYPRLSRHPDPQVLARVNRLLEQRHWRKNLAALACKATIYTDGNPAAGSLGGYDDEAIAVAWLSPALMTVTESGSLYCGGAHPDNHFEPYTFDLLRGDYLDWNRIFPAYVAGEDGWPKPAPALLALIDQARAPLAASQANTAQGTDAAQRDPDDTALEYCGDVWPSYLALGTQAPGALSLSVSGIGHAMGVCLGTHATVPFKDLAPYLTPGGKAYLIPQ